MCQGEGREKSRREPLFFFFFTGEEADGWSDLPPADTVACCGMARAAEWLQREVGKHARDAAVFFLCEHRRVGLWLMQSRVCCFFGAGVNTLPMRTCMYFLLYSVCRDVGY